MRELAASWHRYRLAGGLTIADESPRSLARALLLVLDASNRETPQTDCSAFLDGLLHTLAIDDLAARSVDQRDHNAPSTLRAAAQASLTMAELAGGRAPGRIVLTTYHSAKGREFSVVVLPGLVEGMMPFYFAGRTLGDRDLREQRRNFYVAVTRARDEVVLISGTQFVDPYAGLRRLGRSRFVDDIVSQTDHLA